METIMEQVEAFVYDTITNAPIIKRIKVVRKPAQLSGAWYEIEYNKIDKLAYTRMYLPAKFYSSQNKDHNILYLDKDRFDCLFFKYEFQNQMMRWEWGYEDWCKEARFIQSCCGGDSEDSAINNAIYNAEMDINSIEMAMKKYKDYGDKY